MGNTRRRYLSGPQASGRVCRDPGDSGSSGADSTGNLVTSPPGARRKHSPPAIGARYGELTVRGYDTGPRGGLLAIYVSCSCSPGEEYPCNPHSLLYGRSTRCNTCAKGATARFKKKLYGYAAIMPDDTHRERWLNRWHGIYSRCHRPGSQAYSSYGGRGITLAEVWHDKTQFLRDIQTLEGWEDPMLELDRIDVDKGYAPGNVRMATRAEQCANLRKTIRVTYAGREWCAAHFARELCPGLGPGTVSRWLKQGKSPEYCVEHQHLARASRGVRRT